MTAVTEAAIWTVVIAVSLVTYGLRASFIFGIDYFEAFPPTVDRLRSRSWSTVDSICSGSTAVPQVQQVTLSSTSWSVRLSSLPSSSSVGAAGPSSSSSIP